MGVAFTLCGAQSVMNAARKDMGQYENESMYEYV